MNNHSHSEILPNHPAFQQFDQHDYAQDVKPEILASDGLLEVSHEELSADYKCSDCFQTFFTNEQLDEHKIKKHLKTIVRAHPCPTCPKAFNTKGNLVVHIRSHTEEKPYVCTVCTKSFSVKGNLNTHALSHTAFKPFECEVCTKGFTTKANLQVHMRSHNKERPFECEFCQKSFTTKGNLMTHARTHGDFKPFKCEFCGKEFVTKGNMTTHWNRCKNGFKCDMCQLTLMSKKDLTAHKKVCLLMRRIQNGGDHKEPDYDAKNENNMVLKEPQDQIQTALLAAESNIADSRFII